MTFDAFHRGGSLSGVDLLSRPGDDTMTPCPSGRREFASAPVETVSTPATERMAALAEIAGLVTAPGEKQEFRIASAARKLGLGLRRTRAFWHGEARRVDVEEHERARAVVTPMAARLMRNIEAMRRADAEFHAPQIRELETLLAKAGFRLPGREEE